jgi:hypothetical protein
LTEDAPLTPLVESVTTAARAGRFL